MYDVSVAYVPIGRRTFDMEAATAVFESSRDYLASVCKELRAPDGIVTSVGELKDELSRRRCGEVDIVLFQPTTFADADFVAAVADACPDRPIVVWSVREPSVGGRLRLNSLTGANSACHMLRSRGREFDFLHGNPEEPSVRAALANKLAALQTRKRLSALTIGVLGDHPPGFDFSGADEEELRRRVGARLHRIDLPAMFREAEALGEEEWRPMLGRAATMVRRLDTESEPARKFARFSTCLKRYAEREGIAGIAVRCWPEFFADFGAAACSTLSQLIEDGVVASCESDIHGAITMFIERELSDGKPPYLGDLVHLDEAANSVVFWHCGAGAYSLAHPSTGAVAGVQPNRKLGFALDFGLKPGSVTIARLSYSRDGYRMLIMRGEAADGAQPFEGTSVAVRLNGDASAILRSLMLDGFEPHYAIVYDDIVDRLKELCRLLRLDYVIYE